MNSEPERLQKVLARAGVGSRRSVEELIVGGRVRVNGKRAVLGQKVMPDKDKVEVDGAVVPVDPDLVSYLVNKPAGVVTTGRDPQGRPTVTELFDLPVRAWPVGRLDIDTEGALVLSNDGDLTQRLTHPRYGVAEVYVVEARGEMRRSSLRALAMGVELPDGITAPAQVRLLGRRRGATAVELTIREGRNRQVRRMFEALGHDVTRLVRVKIGPLELGRLKPAKARRLSSQEVAALYGAAQAPAPRGFRSNLST